MLVAALSSAVVVALAVAQLLGVPVAAFSGRRTRQSPRSTWLAQADAPVTPTQFGAVSVALAVVVFGLGWAVTSVPAVAVVPAAAAGWAPRAWYARHRAQRRRDLRAAWPDGLRDLRSSVAAGLSLHQALLGLAERGPEPLRVAFDRYDSRARTLGVVAALRTTQEELADPTSDTVLEVLVLAQERGGAVLGEILTELATATGLDLEAEEAVLTESLEQRINAKAVFVLPWLVLLALTIQGGVFRDFYRSAAGTLVIVVGAVMSLTGAAIVGRLARQPDEPRVLGAGAWDGP